MVTVDHDRRVRRAMARGAGRGPRIGFVPTMGALHAGHGALIDASVAECDVTVVSIFVNPLQFGPAEDFHKYPRDLEADQAFCRERGVDIVFAPSDEEMYPRPATGLCRGGRAHRRPLRRLSPGALPGRDDGRHQALSHRPARRRLFRAKGFPAGGGHPADGGRPQLPVEIRRCPPCEEADGLGDELPQPLPQP